MDPKFQPIEPTFETTLTDVSELRRKFAAQDTNDWPRYKLIVINAVTSGQRLEQRMANAEVQIEHKLARKTAVDNLADDVNVLKNSAAGRKSFIKRWGGRLWTIFLVLFTAYLTKRFGR